jgi:acyl dehydratase
MMAFARDYDRITLDTDEEYAKGTIFGKLIAPGVMSFMSVWAKYLENDFVGEELIAGKSTKMEWFKPVYADDVLVGKVTITDLVKRNARNGLVTVTIDIYNQNGELVLKDVTESVVKCRPE